MRIAITGHTSGIGKATVDLLEQNGFKCSGFSRSNGYDISNQEHLTKLANEIIDFDVFINNASSEWSQVELLYTVFNHWKNKTRRIINISSNSGDGIKTYAYKYAVEKAALDKATIQLNNIRDAKCRVTNIRPGWVNTPRIAHLKIQDPMLDVKDIAGTILYILSLPAHVNISLINLEAKVQ